MFGMGPRDQSSESPRCGIAGQSRSIRSQQNGLFAAATNELLYRLRAVEDSGRSFGNHGEPTLAVGDDHVALIVHRGIEAQMMLVEQSLGGVRVRAFQANERSVLLHLAFPQCLLRQVFRCESVFRVSGDDIETQPANRNRLHRRTFARRGDEMQIGTSKRGLRGLCYQACGGEERKCSKGERGASQLQQEVGLLSPKPIIAVLMRTVRKRDASSFGAGA